MGHHGVGHVRVIHPHWRIRPIPGQEGNIQSN